MQSHEATRQGENIQSRSHEATVTPPRGKAATLTDPQPLHKEAASV